MTAEPAHRIAVLVDVQNIYYTVREKFAASFDYNAFWAELSQLGEIVVANAYATDRGDEKQRQFQNILRAIGFNVKLKPYIQRSDGSTKGDWDVGITIDAIDCASDIDTLVLLSGDGDFTEMVDYVRKKHNISVVVFGVEGHTAATLIQHVNEFRPIDDHLLLPSKYRAS
uniref:LabA-like NYN domain-containing protein n=1 Tax=Thaumasiovibrio occultus TaxID=1891184 RepID=UPI000B356DC0|nr:NYN domain-containing protein [Thaumasiovibrio occultus]